MLYGEDPRNKTDNFSNYRDKSHIFKCLKTLKLLSFWIQAVVWALATIIFHGSDHGDSHCLDSGGKECTYLAMAPVNFHFLHLTPLPELIFFFAKIGCCQLLKKKAPLLDIFFKLARYTDSDSGTNLGTEPHPWPLSSVTLPIKTTTYRHQWGPSMETDASLALAFHLVTGGRGCGKKIKGEEKLFY